MNKLSRLLLEAEENNTRIDGVERSVRALVTDRTRTFTADGVTDGDKTSFGTVKAEGAAVIVAFSGGPYALMFGEHEAARGMSPLFAVLDGLGELYLDGQASGARAVAIGAQKTE